jgi:hypothetical protein
MRIVLPILLAFAWSHAIAADSEPWTDATWHPLAADRLPEGADPARCCATTMTIGGADIEVVLADGRTPLPRPLVLRWIGHAAQAISGYYQHFTVPAVRIVVSEEGDGGVGGGKELDGHLIRVGLGAGTTQADLEDDWIITHEMVHLSFPDLDERYNWMEEGLATWLEPLVRARQGRLGADRVWGDLVNGLPKGQPEAGDLGLDRTPTWGRTYWGGAGYWLLADLGIRERTQGRKSLDDVLRAVNAAGGDGSATWTLERVFAVAKDATGTDVLQELHGRLGEKPEAIDLDGLWRRLGVATAADGVRFDDHAPEAAFRRAVTTADR